MSFKDTFALIDGFITANTATLPADLTTTLQDASRGPTWRLCGAIEALCGAHAGQTDPLRGASRALAEQLIAYANTYSFFGWDYASMLTQLAADDAPPPAPPSPPSPPSGS